MSHNAPTELVGVWGEFTKKTCIPPTQTEKWRSRASGSSWGDCASICLNLRCPLIALTWDPTHASFPLPEVQSPAKGTRRAGRRAQQVSALRHPRSGSAAYCTRPATEDGSLGKPAAPDARPERAPGRGEMVRSGVGNDRGPFGCCASPRWVWRRSPQLRDRGWRYSRRCSGRLAVFQSGQVHDGKPKGRYTGENSANRDPVAED